MIGLLGILGIGLLLGVRHATDADHVIAVSAIVARERRLGHALRIGMMWGIGHTLTILIVGTAIILLKVSVPPVLGLSMEFAVAIMLIVLGVLNLLGIPKRQEAPPYPVRPLLVGLVHGLAGSAAVALLVLTALSDPRWSAAYLLVFGVGTIGGMMGVTLAMAAPLRMASLRFAAFDRYLRYASGALSLGFGIFLAHHIGFVDGLFTGNPTWDPH